MPFYPPLIFKTQALKYTNDSRKVKIIPSFKANLNVKPSNPYH